MTIRVDERVEGGLLGLLVGDALGVPYEFRAPTALPPPSAIEMEPPPGFRPSHAVPPGTFSDDGSMALCLLASLLARGRVDPDDLAARFIAWWRQGYLASNEHVFDIGAQTAAALRAIEQGAAPLDAAPPDEQSNGNGSLMRVLPLALWHRGTDADLVAAAHLSSRVTHAHPRAQVCCALYCLWARRELAAEAPDAAFGAATATLRALYATSPYAATPAFRRELEEHFGPETPPRGTGTGYVVDCLHSARQVLAETADYESAVRAAIALGNDTDTTACVAGGIAGVRYGRAAIPERWVAVLRGRAFVEPLLAELLAHVAARS